MPDPLEGALMVYPPTPPPCCIPCGYPLVWAHSLHKWVVAEFGPTDCRRDPEGIYHRPPDGVMAPRERTEGVRLNARQFADTVGVPAERVAEALQRARAAGSAPDLAGVEPALGRLHWHDDLAAWWETAAGEPAG